MLEKIGVLLRALIARIIIEYYKIFEEEARIFVAIATSSKKLLVSIV